MNTADLLLANLERLLSSPTSAETIRKLIFDLAIRGQLTTQSDKDEPASVLIAKVIRTAQAEDRKFSAEPAVTERPFELPSGWEWVRLGNTGKIFNGTSASAGEKARLSKTPDGLPFIATKDVGYGRDPLSYENGLKVPHGDKDYKVAKSGAVLICAEGGSAGRKVGQTNRPICFGNKLYANETWSGIEAGYILSLYQSNFFYGEFKAKMAGIIGGIARSDFRSLRIPLPPLAEQRRIVAKVDELMALCDRLEAQLKERDVKQAALARAALAKFTEDPTPENLQLLFHPSYSIMPADLRKSILTLAVLGKLVPQDPRDEPAEVLAAELESLKSQLIVSRLIRNQKVADCLSEDDFPFAIHASWKFIRLGHAVRLLGGYAYESGAYVPISNNQVIRIGNVKSDALLLDQKPTYIPDSLAEQTAEYAILEGDILITMTGTKGKQDYAFTLTVKQADLNERRLFLNQRVGAIRPFRRELVALINVFLKSGQLLDLIFATSSGTANQANIGTSSILDLPFPLPPLAEQRRIVAKVEQLMVLVDALEAQLDASRTTGENLLEAMVAELTSA